jgi:hypothetical protein
MPRKSPAKVLEDDPSLRLDGGYPGLEVRVSPATVGPSLAADRDAHLPADLGVGHVTALLDPQPR